MATITEKLERLEQLEEVIALVKPSYKFMLTDIKHRADEIKPGDYSPEMKEALAVSEVLEVV